MERKQGWFRFAGSGGWWRRSSPDRTAPKGWVSQTAPILIGSSKERLRTPRAPDRRWRQGQKGALPHPYPREFGMSELHDDFPGLMERVLAGSQEAARELAREYGPYLLYAVRKRLHRKLRSKFDSQDFVQDVWASFFTDLPNGGAFREPDDLIAFLAQMARNKIIDATRQRLRDQKYNLDREESINNVDPDDTPGLAARQPSPSQVAMGREEWERLLGRQPPVYRRILLLLHDGKTPAATAEDVGVTEKTVRRVAARVAPWLIG